MATLSYIIYVDTTDERQHIRGLNPKQAAVALKEFAEKYAAKHGCEVDKVIESYTGPHKIEATYSSGPKMFIAGHDVDENRLNGWEEHLLSIDD